MSGAGIALGGVARPDAVASAAARVAAAAAAGALGCSGVEVRAAVQDMIDQGLLRREAEDLAYCSAGHSFDRALETCPKCGAEAGNFASSAALLSADDEVSRDEEQPVSESEGELSLDEADPPGFLERLELALIESGCADPMKHAAELASFCGGDLPIDGSALRQHAADRGWGREDIDRIERALGLLAMSDTPVYAKDSGTAQASADIRIWREGRYLRWEIVDHLQGLNQTSRPGSVMLGGIRVTRERANRLMTERTERLDALVRALIEKRKTFFDEQDPAVAAKILSDEPLTQKEICATTGIPPAALSRWCDYRGRQRKRSKGTSAESREISMRMGVELETPHGILPLAAFFSAPARLKGAGGRSQEAIQQDVDQVLAEIQDQGLDTTAIIERVRAEHGIELADRTVRKYRGRFKPAAQGVPP